MAQFIVLAADGKTIIRMGRCADHDVDLQVVPAGCSILKFPDAAALPNGNVEWDQAAQVFVPHLASIKRQQVETVKAVMQSYIQAGFVSSAKAAGMIYDSSQQEQLNMVLSAFSGGGLMAKVNQGGVFAPVAHTQAQARQVVADFVAFRDAAFTKLAALGNQIRNANTVAEVQAIAWSPPP